MNTITWWLVAICIAVPFVSVGCTAGAQHGQEVSHALPAHHPRTFHRAPDAIAERCAIISTPAATDGDRDRAHSELLDILRWLPDLAADTPLKRSDWDQVAAIATSLARAVENGAAAPSLEEGVAALRRIEAGLADRDRPDETTKPGPSAGNGATAGATP